MIFACSIYSWLERLIKKAIKLNELAAPTPPRELPFFTTYATSTDTLFIPLEAFSATNQL